MWQAILDLATAGFIAAVFVLARQDDAAAYAVWVGVGGVVLFIVALLMRMEARSDEA